MLDPVLHQTLLIVVILGIVIGFFGQAIPFFPSLLVIWLSIFGYGLLTGFTWLSGILFAAISLIMLGGSLLEQVLMSAGARTQGTGWLALGISLLALLVGSLLWTPLGGLAASFAAVFVVELVRLRDMKRALASAKGMALGCGWSAVARLGVNLAMIGLWLAWFLWIK